MFVVPVKGVISGRAQGLRDSPEKHQISGNVNSSVTATKHLLATTIKSIALLRLGLSMLCSKIFQLFFLAILFYLTYYSQNYAHNSYDYTSDTDNLCTI